MHISNSKFYWSWNRTVDPPAPLENAYNSNYIMDKICLHYMIDYSNNK